MLRTKLIVLNFFCHALFCNKIAFVSSNIIVRMKLTQIVRSEECKLRWIDERNKCNKAGLVA